MLQVCGNDDGVTGGKFDGVQISFIVACIKHIAFLFLPFQNHRVKLSLPLYS